MPASVPFAPTFALLAPGGTLLALVVLSLVPRLRPFRRFAAPVGTGLALLGVLFSLAEPSWPILLSRWQPLRLFGNFPALASDRLVWPLALALTGVAVSAAISQTGRPPRHPTLLSAAALGMLSFGLLAIWAENLLALILAWGAFDLFWGTGMVALGMPPSRILWKMGGGVCATLLVWLSSLALERTGTGSIWSLVLSPHPGTEFLLLLAALIRLGVYPLYLTLPLDYERKHPLGLVLFLEPLLAWALLARMFGQAGFPLPTWPWLEGIAAGTFIVGGFLALTGPEKARPIHWLGLSTLGGIFWAGLRAQSAPQAAAIWLTGGTLWALGLALLYLGRGWEQSSPWWTAGPILGALALATTPLLGGTGAPLLGGFRWAAFFLGQALLVAALLEDVLRPPAPEEPVDLWMNIARAVGLAVPSILMGVTALAIPRVVGPSLSHWHPSAPGWSTLSLWVLSTAAGGTLFWAQRTRPAAARWRARTAPVHRFLRLDWAYELLAGALSRGTAILGVAADVAEGAGAVLWALAVFLLILVVVLGL